MINEIETAYLAGFFDGEGTVGIYGSYGQLRLQVGGTDEASIRRFYNRYGGTIPNYVPARSFGKKRMWKWSVTGAKAKTVLADLLPHLHVKKAQAFEALKLPMNFERKRLPITEREYRAELARRLKALKDIPQ